MNRAISSLRRLKPYSLSKIKSLQSKGRFKTKEIRITQSFTTDVFNLVNQERTSRGLSPLRLLSVGRYPDYLGYIATRKGLDMRFYNDFSHKSRTYGTPGEMLTRFGVKWTSYGENIAGGQLTPQAVMNTWMNSPGHRANILNPNFTHLGVGFVPGVSRSRFSRYWVQLFVRL